MPDIKPDRTNWRQFCEEPPLTDAEWDAWSEMVDLLRTNERVEDVVLDATEEEWEAMSAAGFEASPDWTDFVEWADASRRYRRAMMEAVKLGFAEEEG